MKKLPIKNLFTIITLAIFMLLSANAMAQLPNPGLVIDIERTALVITDPQNDFLSPEGVTWVHILLWEKFWGIKQSQ